MPSSSIIHLIALAVLFTALTFLGRGLAKCEGATPPGRDRRIAAALFTIAAALFLAAGVLRSGG